MVKLVHTHALGACGATHESSNLSIPTKVLEKSQKYLEFCERVSEQSDLLHSKRGGRVSPSALVFVGGMGQPMRVRQVIRPGAQSNDWASLFLSAKDSLKFKKGDMVKLVHTHALGACGATHESSSLSIPTRTLK